MVHKGLYFHLRTVLELISCFIRNTLMNFCKPMLSMKTHVNELGL
jgi:hypothetical protein